MINHKESCTSSKSPLSKYLLGGLAVGALALSPFAAHADSSMSSTTTTTTVTTTDGVVASDPILVTGTVENYLVDRAGFVSAMTVRTDGGLQTVRFSPSHARRLSVAAPVGQTVNVWVTPYQMDNNSVAGVWDARGTGEERPSVWLPVNTTSDFDWLAATPYVNAGATERNYSGDLRGVVVDQRGDILALALDTDNGRTLVRVPAELRQIARGHIGGSDRVAELYKGADIEVNGVPEAPRLGHLSPYAQRVAANTIKVNGRNAGAISIQMLPPAQRRGLLGFDVGGAVMNNDNMKDENAAVINSNASMMGYTVYNASDMAMLGDGSTSMMTGDGTMGVNTTSTVTSQTATGRVMIITADNQMLPVVKKNGKVWAMNADGSMSELSRVNGKYVVPADMTGARMMMVMSDDSRLEMDTVNGQMMVIMADGSMAPVTLHTP